MIDHGPPEKDPPIQYILALGVCETLLEEEVEEIIDVSMEIFPTPVIILKFKFAITELGRIFDNKFPKEN